MSISIPFAGRRGKPAKPRRKHRANDRIAELEARHAAELAGLRDENVRLHHFKAAADDHFMLMHQLATDLEVDVRWLRADLAEAQGARAVAEADVEARNGWIADLERQTAELRQRLDVSTFAEAAAARTQEIDVRSLQERFATGPVVALHQAPLAADPTHVPTPAHA